ncbi:MAG: E2/UBC family protein [Balneola sp.]
MKDLPPKNKMLKMEGLNREFELLEEDINFLDSLNLPWETIIIGQQRWLLIYNYTLPEGYTIDNVTVAFLVPKLYPEAALDMAYYHPPIAKKSGNKIPQSNSNQNINGKVFQRWSRHREKENQWDPEFDSIITHFELMNTWITKELER